MYDELDDDNSNTPTSPQRRSAHQGVPTPIPVRLEAAVSDADPCQSDSVGESMTRRQLPQASPGRIAPTERDRRVLRFIGEQYGVTSQLLLHLLSEYPDSRPLTENAGRQVTTRFQHLELANKRRSNGRTWLTLTRKGYQLVDLDFALWRMPTSRLVHTEATAACRVWYESHAKRVVRSGDWICERQLFAERGASSGLHIPDAELRPRNGGPVAAIEVELTLKRPARSRYRDVLNGLRPEIEAVVYWCPSRHVDLLQRNLEHALADTSRHLRIIVKPLPFLAARLLSGWYS